MNLSRTILLSKVCAMASATSLRGTDVRRHLNLFDKNDRIIGGKEATEGRYTYSVALSDDDGTDGQFCGGTLIAPDVVLSAAHCGGDDTPYHVVIGRHNLMDSDEGEEIQIELELLHPQYDDDTTDNDFMLLFLKRNTTVPVQFARVSPDVIPAGQAVTTIGWGDTDIDEENGEYPDELHEVEVFTVTNEECAASDSDEKGYKDDNYEGQITDNMMCAEHASDEKDACSGDSGGPLVVRRTDESEPDVLVGVVSWGVGCAHDDFPGVYARVSAQYDWIKEQVCEHSTNPPADFKCDADKVQGASLTTTQGVSLSTGIQGVTLSTGTGTTAWTPIVEEHFTGGFGLFEHHANNANHYLTAKNRNNVVRIEDGSNGVSELTSNLIPLGTASFSKIRVLFSMYTVGMEHSDKLCLDYVLDNGAVTGERCWSSMHAFDNHRWYDDMSMEFDASSAQNLWIRFRVEGDDNEDDVLLDKVTVQGMA